MRAEQLREWMYREPFQPFRLNLADGRTYDIRYPQMNIVGESVIAIGIPELGPNPRFAEHHEWVDLRLITGIDPLPEPTPLPSP
jgi:hypothetical protein